MLPVKITYDALTGLMLNGDQQRAQNGFVQASIFFMHNVASPKKNSLSGTNTGDLSLWLPPSLVFSLTFFTIWRLIGGQGRNSAGTEMFDLKEGFLSNYLPVVCVSDLTSARVLL